MSKREDDWRFGTDRLDKLRETRFPRLSEEFFEEYVGECWKRGFDPAANYLRADVFHDEQTGLPRLRMALTLEGLRVEATNTGQYGGCDDVTFDPPTGTPRKATITIYRMVKKQRCAFTASALWDECASYPLTDFWERRPWMALGYRARMAALREAFPDKFGGLWAAEELDRAAEPMPTPKTRGSSNLAGVTLAPTTQIEVEGEMTAMGYMDPEHREGVLDRMRETFADLMRLDPKMFWGTALAALKKNPVEFGPLPRKIG